MRMMRAKMKVSKVESFETCQILSFRAVHKSDGPYPPDGRDENNSFARWTPSADLTMTVTNPELFGKITEGEEYYLDFIKDA